MKREAAFAGGRLLSLAIISLAVAAAIVAGLPEPAQSSVGFSRQPVIAQIYGAGGNTGAIYTHDFIEIHNPGVLPVDLMNWSVQYASAAGTFNTGTSLSGVIIEPGGTILVRQAAGAGAGEPLPDYDVSGSIAMSSTQGKVALVSGPSLIGPGGPGHPDVVDFVGYGPASQYEGAGPTPAPSNVTSVMRLDNGNQDTNVNASDFATGSPVPYFSQSHMPTGTPVADGDTGTVAEDATLTVAAPGVLGNDADPKDAPLSAVLGNSPANGTVLLQSDGAYTYRPDDDFFGTDAFTYHAYNGTLYSRAATVTITVTPVSDASSLQLGSSSKTLAAYGSTYSFVGTLSSKGTPISGAQVILEHAKSAAGPFTQLPGTVLTGVDGGFTATLKPAVTTYYRARFGGQENHYDECVSPSVKVTARASVGVPKAPTTMYAKRAKTVYGYLKPRHTSGTYPVRIYKYRYVSGKWKSYGYVKAKASNYSTYTKYSASVKLPYRGKWRLRAYHPADAGHAANWSTKYDYVTVK